MQLSPENNKTLPEPSDTGVCFAEVSRFLSGISASTEGEFLAAGRSLMTLQGHAHNLAAETTGLAELMAGGDGSLTTLNRALAETVTASKDSGLAQWIDRIQAESSLIQSTIREIEPMVRSFNVLGVLTRIESSRFVGGGLAFEALASSVAELSHQIRERVVATSRTSAEIFASANRAAEHMRCSAGRQYASLAGMIERTESELDSIRRHRSEVGSASARLSERYSRISASIGDIVVALQSHDIVRQQIEHIVEALQAARPGEYEVVARLQAAQLQHSYEVFASSVNSVRTALDSAARTIDEVTEESRRCFGSGNGSDGFFTAVKRGLAEILRLLDDHASAGQSLAAAVSAVGERTADISGTISGVREIAIEMQDIALNATIQAARLGQAGSALKTVAISIRALADGMGLTCDKLSKHLQRAQTAVDELTAAVSNRSTSDADLRLAKLHRGETALNEMERSAIDALGRITGMAGHLTAEVHQAVDGFGDHQESLRLMAESIERLRAQAGSADPGAPVLSGVDTTYTMASERAIYRAVLNGSHAQPVEQAVQNDDNVELF